MTYVYMAVGCGVLGLVITFFVLLACQSYDIDIFKNMWVLAIPVTLAVLVNVGLVEIYHRYRRR